MDLRNSNRFIRPLIAFLLLTLAGCGTGYRIHRTSDAETLYHVGEEGHKRIVYVVHKNGALKVHDENDPIVKRFFANIAEESSAKDYFDDLPTLSATHRKWQDAANLIRIGRIKAAKKRDDKDPIYITVHNPELGPRISQYIQDASKTRQRFKRVFDSEFCDDAIIQTTEQKADVEVYIRSCFKKTPALNIETHKLVSVTAFQFEAYIQSNYLPEDNHTVIELGHWMENKAVIRRVTQRVNKVIKEMIGPNIPKDRIKFLKPGPRRV